MPWYISDNNRDYEVPDSISQNDHEQVMSYLKNARSSVQDEANNDFAQTGQVKIPLDTPVQEKSGGIVGTIKGIVDGSISASDVGKGLWDTVTNLHKTIPGWSDRVNSDDPHEREQAVLEGITTIAGTALTGSPAVGGAGTAGMFIGKKGRAALHDGAFDEARAQRNIDTGMSKTSDPKAAKDNIWDQHGIEQFQDGGIRTEISDLPSKIDEGFKQYVESGLKGDNSVRVKGNTLGDIFHHDELYKAYPDLKNVKVDVKFKTAAEEAKNPTINKGSYDPTFDKIELNGGDWNSIKSTLLHEVQHRIQFEEGWSVGGGGKVKDQLRDFFEYDAMTYLSAAKAQAEQEGIKWKGNINREKDIAEKGSAVLSALYNAGLKSREKSTQVTRIKKTDYELYRKLMGEVESRNTQRRAELEQLDPEYTSRVRPGKTMDTPASQTINIIWPDDVINKRQ